ncbi:hypothetical protein [Rhizorhabdus histidinilytica]|uniref:hypothetical protein n=1 Tax=Rhizorhabdus histidinilytica TaxID=439228 RepID=UPI001ADD0E1B|nr:hypothetical protein [Rhizorhabdus histidinilytica]
MGSASGTTFALSATLPATESAADYAALPWVEVGGIEKLGAIGPVSAKIEFQPLVGAKQKHKAGVDYGTLQPNLLLDDDDAGQALFRMAADPKNNDLFASRTIYPSGAIRYSQGKAFGWPENVDGADSALTVSPAFELCKEIVRVNQADLPANPPSISLSAITPATEGNSGTVGRTATATLNRNGSNGSYAFIWSISGTGVRPASASDFAGGVFPSGSGTFAPGETIKTLTWSIQGDLLPEFDESYLLTLTVTGVGSRTATGIILNDDGTSADRTSVTADNTTLTGDMA